MSTRRSHFKSHTGCITCKRRHVKCDEAGPPCNRCEARGVACEYAKITRHAQHPPDSLNDSTKAEEPQKSPSTSPDTLTASPIFPKNRHHLDLQLMHRWSTTTFKCCCTPGTGDEGLWQYTVPALALEHEFLLNGLLALSAFEIANALLSQNNEEASSSNCENYIHAAFEYQDLALSTFRAKLESPGPCADHRASICFSLMLLVLTFASVRFRRKEEKNILQTAIAHFELIRGAVHIADSEEEHQISKNEYVQKLIPFDDLPVLLLEPPVAEIMAKLGELNDQRIIDTAQDVHERRIQQIAFWEACKKGISLLNECFQKCTGPVYRGYALGWLNMTGEEYIKALKTKDDLALLILMLWGAFVERMSDDIWWAKGFGRSLVDEISSDALSVGIDSPIRDTVLQVQQLI